jgi:hypothetical protein
MPASTAARERIVQAVVVHPKHPIIRTRREPHWHAEVLVERASHALEVDLAEILQDVKQQTARGKALSEVVQWAGPEFAMPGAV